jgi:hypothetical protein
MHTRVTFLRFSPAARPKTRTFPRV